MHSEAKATRSAASRCGAGNSIAMAQGETLPSISGRVAMAPQGAKEMRCNVPGDCNAVQGAADTSLHSLCLRAATQMQESICFIHLLCAVSDASPYSQHLHSEAKATRSAASRCGAENSIAMAQGETLQSISGRGAMAPQGAKEMRCNVPSDCNAVRGAADTSRHSLCLRAATQMQETICFIHLLCAVSGASPYSQH